MTHNDLSPPLSESEVADVMDALRQLGATDIKMYFRILLRERDHLRAENKRLQDELAMSCPPPGQLGIEDTLREWQMQCADLAIVNEKLKACIEQKDLEICTLNMKANKLLGRE